MAGNSLGGGKEQGSMHQLLQESANTERRDLHEHGLARTRGGPVQRRISQAMAKRRAPADRDEATPEEDPLDDRHRGWDWENDTGKAHCPDETADTVRFRLGKGHQICDLIHEEEAEDRDLGRPPMQGGIYKLSSYRRGQKWNFLFREI